MYVEDDGLSYGVCAVAKFRVHISKEVKCYGKKATAPQNVTQNRQI
jgi:hypothetical protein